MLACMHACIHACVHTYIHACMQEVAYSCPFGGNGDAHIHDTCIHASTLSGQVHTGQNPISMGLNVLNTRTPVVEALSGITTIGILSDLFKVNS